MGPESEGEDRGTTRRASPRPRARQNPCRKSPASAASQFQGAKQDSESQRSWPEAPHGGTRQRSWKPSRALGAVSLALSALP